MWRHRLTFLNLVMKLLFLLNHNPTLWLLNEHFIWIFMNKTAWHWPDAKLFTVKTSKTGRSKSFSKISALIKYSTCTLKLPSVKVHLVILGREVCNAFDYYTETSILRVILFEESIALIRIWKIWPLGGQNADFILLKLNNRLVDHQVSWNSTFLLFFWKVHGIPSLEQSTVSGAERCALIAAVPKTACNFQHQEYAALLR